MGWGESAEAILNVNTVNMQLKSVPVRSLIACYLIRLDEYSGAVEIFFGKDNSAPRKVDNQKLVYRYVTCSAHTMLIGAQVMDTSNASRRTWVFVSRSTVVKTRYLVTFSSNYCNVLLVIIILEYFQLADVARIGSVCFPSMCHVMRSFGNILYCYVCYVFNRCPIISLYQL